MSPGNGRCRRRAESTRPATSGGFRSKAERIGCTKSGFLPLGKVARSALNVADIVAGPAPSGMILFGVGETESRLSVGWAMTGAVQSAAEHTSALKHDIESRLFNNRIVFIY